jgi:hypothetical protein
LLLAFYSKLDTFQQAPSLREKKKYHFKPRISDRQSVKERADKTTQKETSLQAAGFRQASSERKGKHNYTKRNITSSCGFCHLMDCDSM